MHKVVIDGISDNISELVHNGKYGVINNAYPTTMGYNDVKFFIRTIYVTRRQNSLEESHKDIRTYSKIVIYQYNEIQHKLILATTWN